MVKVDYLGAGAEQHGPVCVLTIDGELDVFTVANLAKSVTAALKTQAEPATSYVCPRTWLAAVAAGKRVPDQPEPNTREA